MFRGTADLVVVHGIPDFPVDVFVDGEELLTDVDFGDSRVGEIDAGPLFLDIAPAGEGVDATVLSVEGAEILDGMSYSVVAHPTEDGEPTVSAGSNVTNEGEGIQFTPAAALGPVDLQPVEVTGVEGLVNPFREFVATAAGRGERVTRSRGSWFRGAPGRRARSRPR